MNTVRRWLACASAIIVAALLIAWGGCEYSIHKWRQQAYGKGSTWTPLAILGESNQLSCMSIHLEDGHQTYNGIIVAIWRSGRIAWSDHLKGGPPYLEGRIDPVRVDELMGRWKNSGLST